MVHTQGVHLGDGKLIITVPVTLPEGTAAVQWESKSGVEEDYVDIEGATSAQLARVPFFRTVTSTNKTFNATVLRAQVTVTKNGRSKTVSSPEVTVEEYTFTPTLTLTGLETDIHRAGETVTAGEPKDREGQQRGGF